MTKLTYTRDEVEELMKLEAKFEQERIIKLYRGWQEQLLATEPYTDKELGDYRDNGYQNSFDYFVALIKGENK
jgi:hypothetical protein